MQPTEYVTFGEIADECAKEAPDLFRSRLVYLQKLLAPFWLDQYRLEGRSIVYLRHNLKWDPLLVSRSWQIVAWHGRT